MDDFDLDKWWHYSQLLVDVYNSRSRKNNSVEPGYNYKDEYTDLPKLEYDRDQKLKKFDKSGIPPPHNPDRMKWLKYYYNELQFFAFDNIHEIFAVENGDGDTEYTYWVSGSQRSILGVSYVKAKNKNVISLDHGIEHTDPSYTTPIMLPNPRCVLWAYKGRFLGVMDWFASVEKTDIVLHLARNTRKLRNYNVTEEEIVLLKLRYG